MDAPESSRPSPGEAARNLLQRLRLRRREPWNWCVQTLSAALLPFGLLGHSPSLLALSLLGLLAGCLALPLPPMAHTELRRILPFVERLIGLESEWLARPMDAKKKRQLVCWSLAVLISAWLLWEQDLGPIGIALAVFVLLRVRRQNVADGIDP